MDNIHEVERLAGMCEMLMREIAELRQQIAGIEIPEGYTLVPNQMTDAMIDSGNVYTLNKETLLRIWQDVLAAVKE